MNVPGIYPHRRNRDGSYDSICLTCFMTASHATKEAELDKQDEMHVCWTSLLLQSGYSHLAQPMQPSSAPVRI
jgi:hypothetical protein